MKVVFMLGFGALLAITIHGLVDVGITNKEAARLIFLVEFCLIGDFEKEEL